MTDLEIIYDYYKHAKQRIKSNYQKKEDENGNLNVIQEDMFGFLIDYYQKNGFPQVLPDDEYKKLEVKEVYRGFKKHEHAGSMLCHYLYHYGRGIIQGMYFSTFKEEALAYTRSCAKDEADESKVIAVKLLGNNGMNLSDLLELRRLHYKELPPSVNPEYLKKKKELLDFYNHLKNLGDEDATEFYNIMKRPGVFAVYLGLDYVFREGAKHHIVFNRNIVAVKESDFKKMCENTQHYKNGHFDFYDCEYSESEK